MIQPFIDNELGHVSYILYHKKECIVIDAKRDIDEYVEFIDKNDLELKYIFNTHFHADFVAGHNELKDRYTNATILELKPQTLYLGDLKLEFISTAGHTPNCISLLVDNYIFTGDFLFVGDMGRIDLLGDETKESLANKSYESAQKLWKLDDNTIVLTSHIKGSFCGGGLGSSYISTIGIEKQTNKIFSIKDKNKYISKLLNEKIEKPLFFSKLPKINQNPPLLKTLKEPKNIDIILDIRKPNKFKKAHIPKSINIYQKANLPLILGSLVDIDTKIGIVGDENSDFEDVLKRLRRVGFDKLKVLGDIRKFETIPFEVEKKEIIDLEKISLNEILKYKDYSFKCKNGYKSMAVESFLKGLE